MTYKEFFAELEKLRDKDWTLKGGEMIRCNKNCDCPITAVAKAKGVLEDDATAEDVGNAAEDLGLSWANGFALQDAADSSSKDPMRKRILKAVGLDAGS